MPIGRILALVGLALILVGFYFVSVSLEAGGIVLGIAGYALGSRRLSTVTVVLGVAIMMFSLVTQQYPVGPGS